MRILVAYDGSPAANAAVNEVLRRAWPERTEVRLVTIVDRSLSTPPADGMEVYAPLVEGFRASLRKEAHHQIQQALGKFAARPDLQLSYELRDGSVKKALLEAIRDWKTDLVFAGSCGSNSLARLFVGSVCHTLVAHAPCNVEIVRAAPPPS